MVFGSARAATARFRLICLWACIRTCIRSMREVLGVHIPLYIT